jgi:hypothetical protein
VSPSFGGSPSEPDGEAPFRSTGNSDDPRTELLVPERLSIPSIHWKLSRSRWASADLTVFAVSLERLIDAGRLALSDRIGRSFARSDSPALLAV